MAADTYDPILGIILQGTGNNNNSWGDTFNTNAVNPIARAIGGVAVHTNTGGTLDLSGSPPPTGLRQDVDYIQKFTGVLTSHLTIVVPNLSKSWAFLNATSGTFNLYAKTPSMATPIQIPQGTMKIVVGDGGDALYRADREEVGAFRISGKATAGSGELACNGASLLRSDYPDLFGAIGTSWGAVDGTHFSLPDLITNNRFLRAAGGSLAVGTTQSNQNQAHTHAFSGSMSAGTLSTDVQGNHSHTANTSDPQHHHGIVAAALFTAPAGAASNECLANAFNSNTNDASTGINVSIVPNGSHAHNVVGAPGIGTLATVSQGGSEARPENAAVLICIRY